jgi:hypothetical protein
MTRLVDVDKIVYYTPRMSDGDGLFVKWMKEILSNAPTVDAETMWIPCSERLPDDDRSKVVTLANGNVEAGYYSNGDWWCIGDSISLENPTVIAWMPLPEKYKPYEVDE